MIYLDNAATTPLSQSVREAMRPYYEGVYGNPSSIHQAGRASRHAVDESRRTIADWLGCKAEDLIFTSGGTEADATALVGAYLARRGTRNHIVTTAVEHHAVLHTVDFLQSLGAEVSVVPVNREGRVLVKNVVDALRSDTALVSVMAVNNELGTVEPIEEIAKAVRAVDSGVLIHSDMVQLLPVAERPLADSVVHLASFSAHKIHGPKGIGALYVQKDTPWRPVLHGGAQEKKRRGGTENVAGIVGFAAAIRELRDNFAQCTRLLTALNTAFWETLSSQCEVVRLSPEDAAATILNVAFPGLRNDTLLMRLDMEGVLASAGSACTAGSLEPSHVLEACGHEAHLTEAIRFSFSTQNTIFEVTEAAKIVAGIVQSMSKYRTS